MDSLPLWGQSLWKEKSDEGFMRQRGASWELRVYLGRDPLTGKKRYATRTEDFCLRTVSLPATLVHT